MANPTFKHFNVWPSSYMVSSMLLLTQETTRGKITRVGQSVLRNGTCTYIHGVRYEAKKKGKRLTADSFYVAPQHRQQAAARAWCMWCMGPCRQQRTAGTHRYVMLPAVLLSVVPITLTAVLLVLYAITQQEASSKQRRTEVVVWSGDRSQARTKATSQSTARPHAHGAASCCCWAAGLKLRSQLRVSMLSACY